MEQQRVHGIVRIATKYGLIQGVLSFGIFFARTAAAMRQNRLASVANAALLIVLTIRAFLINLEGRKSNTLQYTIHCNGG